MLDRLEVSGDPGEEREHGRVDEDDPVGGLLLSEAVRSVGLEPRLFSNGSEALGELLICEPAVVLLDVDMPGMDGYTVCRKARDAKQNQE